MMLTTLPVSIKKQYLVILQSILRSFPRFTELPAALTAGFSSFFDYGFAYHSSPRT